MRFIIGFIFFGVLFYLIWKFFPDLFQTLFSWVETSINWVTSHFPAKAPAAVPPVTPQG